MADLVIQEPKFSDNASRCFQLPFIACETLTTDVQVVSDGMLGGRSEEESKQQSQQVQQPLLDRLVSFFLAPDPQMKADSKYLNPTLGGYLNKILSFWLMKRPEDFIVHIIKKRDLI